MKFKKLIAILSITTLVGLVGGCSKKDTEQSQNNTVKQESQMDKSESQIDNIKGEEEVEHIKDKEETQVGNIEDKEESQEDKIISEEEALAICKEKLSEIWNYDFLKLGSDKSGIDKIVNIKDKIYYAIYHIDEEHDIMADFRFLVDQSSGEVFYQDPEDLNKLVSIDEYILKLKK